MNRVLTLQRDILHSYEDDMVKYAEETDKPLIKECFASIPKQLSKENKKFQYSVVKKGATASKFRGSLQWIEDSGLEVDFVTRYKGGATLVEVKASSGNTKSTKTVLAHPEKYRVSGAIKLGNYNVGRSGSILTLPLYMAFLLREY